MMKCYLLFNIGQNERMGKLLSLEGREALAFLNLGFLSGLRTTVRITMFPGAEASEGCGNLRQRR